MKYTLLELVQSILRSMESDEVSDVNETQESKDVADIIKECYFDITGYADLKEHEGPFKLDASTDDTKPALMYIPSNVVKIDWLKYNHATLDKPDYTPIRFVCNEEFIHYQSGIDPDDDVTQSMSVDINGTEFIFQIKNDRVPSYYTIFDERLVVFNSFDVDLGNTLTQIRTLGYGKLSTTFQYVNTWIPDLDHRQFQLLLQDAKSTAHVELKQAPNPKAEQKYRANRILAQKTKDDNDPASSRQKNYLQGRNVGRGRIKFR